MQCKPNVKVKGRVFLAEQKNKKSMCQKKKERKIRKWLLLELVVATLVDVMFEQEEDVASFLGHTHVNNA